MNSRSDTAVVFFPELPKYDKTFIFANIQPTLCFLLYIKKVGYGINCTIVFHAFLVELYLSKIYMDEIITFEVDFFILNQDSPDP